MAKPRFSHLRAGDLATLHTASGEVPVKVAAVTDGDTATVVSTAARETYPKGTEFEVDDNLTTQVLTTRTASATTLLVFTR